jgi:hypothetical protein
MNIEDVEFRPVSESQKPECLFCTKPSVLEAVMHRGFVLSTVRCCETEACKKKAAEFALIPFTISGHGETIH